MKHIYLIVREGGKERLTCDEQQVSNVLEMRLKKRRKKRWWWW